MPSLATVYGKDDRLTTWEKLYRALKKSGRTDFTEDDIMYIVRRTTGLEFQPGTNAARIIREMRKAGFLWATADNPPKWQCNPPKTIPYTRRFPELPVDTRSYEVRIELYDEEQDKMDWVVHTSFKSKDEAMKLYKRLHKRHPYNRLKLVDKVVVESCWESCDW